MFQLLDIGVDPPKLSGNRNALRALRDALLAPDAVVRLTQGRDRSVVAHKVGLAELPVVLLLLAPGLHTLVDGVVVVHEYSRNINPVRAGHAVLAVVAFDSRIVGHDVGNVSVQEGQLFFSQWLEVHVGPEVVLEVLHIDHAAQHAENPWV